MNQKTIDLHVHSTYSDGTYTPQQLVLLAKEKELAAIALTDHDTTNGISVLQSSLKEYPELQIIPGIEISVSYKKKDIHILGLFIDPNNKTLNDSLHTMIENRTARNEKMAQNLRNIGIDITVEALIVDDPNSVITRAHFARYLTNHGYTKSNEDAFKRYLNDDSPYYVPREYIAPKDAIMNIHQAGGIALLAHPMLYHLPDKELKYLFTQLKDYGLDGIEVIHSSHSTMDQYYLRQLANQYGFVKSGGSDFHGTNKPQVQLGTGKGNLSIPYSYLEDLIAYHNTLKLSL